MTVIEDETWKNDLVAGNEVGLVGYWQRIRGPGAFVNRLVTGIACVESLVIQAGIECSYLRPLRGARDVPGGT